MINKSQEAAKEAWPSGLNPSLEIKPESFFQKGLRLVGSDQGFVLIAVALNNVFSFLSNVTMARVLSLSDYGVYASGVALFSFVILLTGTIQATAAQIMARRVEEQGEASVWRFLQISFISLSVVGIILFVALLPVCSFLAEFLRVETSLIVYILLGLLVFAPYALTLGTLQGLQRFRFFGVGMAFSNIFRLPGGLGLVLLGLGLSGAVISMPLALGLGVIVNIVMLRWIYQNQKKANNSGSVPATKESVAQIMRVFLVTGSFTLYGMLGFTFLTSSDVILVQHFFGREMAGQYAAVATLGKIVLYFTGSLSLILLPKATQAAARGENAVGLLRRSLLAAFGLGLLALAGLAIGGGFIIKLFVSSFPVNLDWLIAFHGGAMLLYSLASVWLAFFISVKQYLYVVCIVPILFLQVALVYVWHTSLGEVTGLLYVAGLLLYLLGEGCLWSYKRKISLIVKKGSQNKSL